MTFPELVDKIKIGLVTFEAYIIIDENNLEAFAIYIENHKEPLLIFKQDKNDGTINIDLNQEILNEMKRLRAKNPDQRKEDFKNFQRFVLDTEQHAKEMVLKDRKLNYVADVKLLKEIEKSYLES